MPPVLVTVMHGDLGLSNERLTVPVESAYEQLWIVIEVLDKDPPKRWPGELAAAATEPELSRQIRAATARYNNHEHLNNVPTTHISAIRGAFGGPRHHRRLPDYHD